MQQQHPVIALWAHPRSMSTATERIMRERGDCKVFHEPFLAYYYLQLKAADMPMLDTSNIGPTSYESIRDSLINAAQSRPVFFKDMSYFVTPRLFDDTAFCKRLFNVFLIRDPRRSIASYYKLDPGVTQIEIGIEAQWRHYQFLSESLGLDAIVIRAETLASNPRTVLGAVWERAGLPYNEEAFHWQADAPPDDWNFVQGWHQQATASTGLKVDQSDPGHLFSNACKQAPHLQDYLDFHWQAYQELLKLSV